VWEKGRGKGTFCTS